MLSALLMLLPVLLGLTSPVLLVMSLLARLSVLPLPGLWRRPPLWEPSLVLCLRSSLMALNGLMTACPLLLVATLRSRVLSTATSLLSGLLRFLSEQSLSTIRVRVLRVYPFHG